MPGAANLPVAAVLKDGDAASFKPAEEAAAAFEAAGVTSDRPVGRRAFVPCLLSFQKKGTPRAECGLELCRMCAFAWCRS
jgi:hypothetical protein